jgi:hypothetical protein
MIETPGLDGDSTIATSKISAPKQYFSCQIASGINGRRILTMMAKPNLRTLLESMLKLKLPFGIKGFDHNTSPSA